VIAGRTKKVVYGLAAGIVLFLSAALLVAYYLRPAPIIVSSEWFSGAGSLGSSASAAQLGSHDEATPRAQISFKRIVAAEELLQLLQAENLRLDSIRYLDVGPGSGSVAFSHDADTRTAIAAAESHVRYRKLAQAYALQLGANLVFVKGMGPMGIAMPVHAPGRPGNVDTANAPRVTMEELDAMPLPECTADDRIEQPLPSDESSRHMIEAACGFRPYAIRVYGGRAEIEAFSQKHDVVDRVAFDPPSN
jgi:hypothetical protein